MIKTAFLHQTRYVVRYLGSVIDDARLLQGVWYGREGSNICKLRFQDEVRIVTQCGPALATHNTGGAD